MRWNGCPAQSEVRKNLRNEWAGFHERRRNTASPHSTTAGPNESVIACFVLILMQLTKMASSVQTPHGERNCSGGKSVSPSERRKRREVRPFIKLSFPNTPSAFSCWLMSPLQSRNVEHKKMWFVQRSPRASGRWYPPRITRNSTRHTGNRKRGDSWISTALRMQLMLTSC